MQGNCNMNKKYSLSAPSLFAKTPCGSAIVSMVEHKGTLFVATKERVYALTDKGTFTIVLFNHEGKEK